MMHLKQPQNEQCIKHQPDQCSNGDPIEGMDVKTSEECDVVRKEVIDEEVEMLVENLEDNVPNDELGGDVFSDDNQVGVLDDDSDSDDEEMSNARYRKTATILVILCLINMVVYIKIFAEIMLTTNWKTEKHTSIILAMLLIAIAIELMGLVAILCRSRILVLLYGISMVIALICMIYLLMRYSLGALVVTIVNVFAIWRCYYLMVSQRMRKKSRTRMNGVGVGGGRCDSQMDQG